MIATLESEPPPRQLELGMGEPVSTENVGRFVGWLAWRGWAKRRELVRVFGVSERTIRALAEAAGAEVIRGPKGFAHIENVPADEARHCAEIALSQGKKMIRWGLAVKRRLHGRIG
jgi:hypothetical protein